MNPLVKPLLSVAGLLAVLASAAAADIVVEHPYARATPKGATVGAAYATIVNTGGADRLVSVSVDAAPRAQIHEVAKDAAGVMKMRELEGGLPVPAGATVALKPGGYHVMMLDLPRPLAAGETVRGVLTFEKAGRIEVAFPVEAIGAMPGHMGGDHSGMGH